MDAKRWSQIKEVYDRALDLGGEECEGFLAEACGDDEDLRREVESLLAAHEEAGKFLQSPAVEVAAREIITDEVASPAPQLIGRELANYKIISLLGRGGMGEVYLAEDKRLRRNVALKLLPAQFMNDAERVRRFEREAAAASATNHPNILTIHEIGEVDGAHYIVTEFVEGETLRALIKRGRPGISEAIGIAEQVAGALGVAHEAGIIHRDIKPENVMARADGLVKVLDFGLAKLTERTTAASEVDSQAEQMARLSTEPGVVMGTPAYMSPEQARGQELDARTDLFSFGVMLYEMATGYAPFKGETHAAVFAELLKHLPPPVRELNPDLPVELEQVVGKALEKDREARYQSAKDLLADLKLLSRDVSSKQALASAGVANRRKAHSGAKPRRMRAALVVALSFTAAGALLLSGLAVWRSLIPRRRAEPPSVRRLTFNQAMDVFPVFSPNDRQIAFISNRDGKPALFVMSADGGDARRITDVSYGSSFPQWSPNGKRIAFESGRDGGMGIFLINPDGSDMVKLIDNAGWPAWSPDGKRIAFHRGREAAVEIYVVNLSGGDPVRLTNNAAFDANPSWSPDGSQIVFSRDTAPGVLNVFVMNADGSGQRQLTNFKAWAGGPMWSPDGKRIAFGMSSSMAVIDHAIYLMEPDGSGTVKLPWFNKSNSGGWFSWSRDGKRLVTTSEQTGDDEIYIVSAEFSADTRLTRHVADDVQPDWSPDGKQIVFVSARDGGRAIYAMNADGANVRKLHDLDWRAVYARPRWSPDGARIAFVEARDGYYAVCSMNANGADIKRLTDHNTSDPFWFPDGNRILFISGHDGKSRLYTMNSDGRDQQRIAHVSLAARFPALSPDGQKIALIGTEQSQENAFPNDLYLVDHLNGGRPRKLSPVVGEYGPPAWSPDGQKIAVSVRNEDGGIIWVMDADGRRPVRLTAKGQLNSGPRWSPDGSKLLYHSSRDGNAEIYVMDLTLIPLKFMATE